MDDDSAIRKLVSDWLSASKAGDTKTVLSLMADDVVFMVPGMEPFGKEAFEKASEKQKDLLIEGKSDIKEIKVLGDWAFMRSRLEISVSKKGEEPKFKSGYVLTILKKEGGQWKIARDANLLSEI